MSTATAAPAAASAVLDAVREGRTHLVPGLVKPLTAAERRALVPELTTLRREIRGWDWSRRSEYERIRPGLLVAGAGCHTGAAAAASWIAARDLWDTRESVNGILIDVLAARDPAWLGDLAHRLAARTATVESQYRLIRELLLRAPDDCPAPTGDAFVHAWARQMAHRGHGGSTGTLRLALHAEPYVRELVPRLFETAETAVALHWYGAPGAPGCWPAELAALAAQGTVERRMLLDGCLARLLRGGRPAGLTFFTDLLGVLEPTEDEQAERTADWMALAADAHSPLAGHAQQVLAGLFEAGRLPAERLAEMSAAVLFRPEKKLVRAQLVLLGKALRRERDDRSVLLPAVAAAFGHADTALQERALKLVAAHLRPEDDDLRTELAFQADLLSPVHRRAAADLLGAVADAVADGTPYTETLPPAPVRRRLDSAAQLSVAETVELVAALVKSRRPTTEEFETAFDALVRHAHRDRAELGVALRPALADRPWIGDGGYHADPEWLQGLELVAATVMGHIRFYDLRAGRGLRDDRSGRDCAHTAMAGVTGARLYEAAARILADPLPFLLATPTWDTGSLEPSDLVERLAAYGRLGVEPEPADFGQALLRVRRDPEAAPAAAALGTPEGARLAAWLTGAGEPPRTVRRVEEPAPPRPGWWGGRMRESVRRIVVDTEERPVLSRDFPAPFHRLGRAFNGGSADPCYHWEGRELAQLAVLPEDRETQAVMLLPELTACAAVEERGAGQRLSRLAEMGGPAGPVLHLAVATGLGARHAEDRLAAVDALLVLAARGELGAATLGQDLAELLALGTVKPNRLADALRTAAGTGAYATTWAVLAGALPALLADGGLRGAGEVLAVAAECVEACGAAGPEPAGLSAVAGRGGSSQLVAQAGRLRTALATAGV
ncbi:hypothetical protein HYE82_11230 [Streptomyces sp. BR123]|uniref:DUF6493 family protein n=1 Tax=Streptomyces sp. BR123 TaxID=2749828 RepID=UPI0015C482BC|nr:DUF6493 family protein [Streptomyces sp. BR123]NXY94956.1 hypothetical protein [Streptomyces sp. BR123]